MVDSPLGNIQGAPEGFVPTQATAVQMQPSLGVVNEPLPDLTNRLEEANTVEELVDFAQEILASLVNAKPEQSQAVQERNVLLNQVYRLIEVKQRAS